MNVFDLIVLILILLFLVRGVWVGLISQIAFLAALILGFAAAGAFYGDAAGMLSPLISHPQLSFLITYILLFLAVYLLVMLIGLGLRKVVNISMLGWFDRLMGAVFGLSKAVFVASLLFIVLAGFLAGSRPYLRAARCYPYLAVSSKYLLSLIEDSDLRSQFLPSEPAISSLLSSAVPAGEPLRRAAEEETEDNRLIQ